MANPRRGRRGGKRATKRKVQRKRVARKSTVAEKASLSETKGLSVLQTNQMYQQVALQLSNYPRAVNVAKAYQMYRIKSVKYVIQPLSDTFIATGPAASGSTVPYLYYMIDRTKNLLAANTAQALKRAGARPHRIDERAVSFSYRPSVLQANLDVQTPITSSYTSYKMSPWLNTRDISQVGVWNPDSTDHQGIKFIVENSGGANVAFKCDMIVEFEFKKPSNDLTPSETMPTPVDLETVPERPESNIPE